MNKRRITFAAIIIALMLITIVVCFYLLVRPAFIVLTGALAAYGYIRGAVDLRNWLAKENEALVPINLSKPIHEQHKEETPIPTVYGEPVTFGDKYVTALSLTGGRNDVDAIIEEVMHND